MDHLTLTASSTMGRHLRPREAAEAMGVSLSSFWRLAKQPDFPTLIPLSARVTVVREADLADFMELRAKAARAAKNPGTEGA